MIIKAPNPYPTDRPSFFLAGSIEMGTARNWQPEIAALLDSPDIVILDPRRDDWDRSWEQRATNPPFREQVEWELDALSHASMILLYFDPATKSPITLLELGLYINRPMLVCCPDGYWRRGNVEIVCERWGMPLVNTFEEFCQRACEIRDGLLAPHDHANSGPAGAARERRRGVRGRRGRR